MQVRVVTKGAVAVNPHRSLVLTTLLLQFSTRQVLGGKTILVAEEQSEILITAC
jgi:hypothetical protein